MLVPVSWNVIAQLTYRLQGTTLHSQMKLCLATETIIHPEACSSYFEASAFVYGGLGEKRLVVNIMNVLSIQVTLFPLVTHPVHALPLAMAILPGKDVLGLPKRNQ